MAHELRSPLTSIKGFSSMLVSKWDRFDDEQKFEFVETIHYDAERMSRIVAEVLDLARMEAGRLELSPTNTTVASAADAAVEAVRHLDGSGRVHVDVPGDVAVYADPGRVANILSNLLENGVKFSDIGAVTVSATASGDEVEIVVTDSGVGIEADRLPHIFEGPAPEAGAKAGPSGTGLGLYLTRGLVELHGGSIEAASKPGEGSTFTVRLPAARGADV